MHLDAARPDAIVVIANDHFNTFFLNNLPTFAIGVAEATFGPNDQTKMPSYSIKVHTVLAEHVRRVGIRDGFDLAVTQEFGIDHAMTVPLHYLTDGIPTPVVPIWVNTFVKPLPTAQRCYALGRMVRNAIDSLTDKLRVAVIGTGGFSLRSAGRDRPGQAQRRTRSRYLVEQVHAHIGGAPRPAGRGSDGERMWNAGNIGGELLNWIVTLGVSERETAISPIAVRRTGTHTPPGAGTDTMSAYQINKLCHRVFHDVAFREAVRERSRRRDRSWPFTDDERKALLEDDIRGLYDGARIRSCSPISRAGAVRATPPCPPIAFKARDQTSRGA